MFPMFSVPLTPQQQEERRRHIERVKDNARKLYRWIESLDGDSIDALDTLMQSIIAGGPDPDGAYSTARYYLGVVQMRMMAVTGTTPVDRDPDLELQDLLTQASGGDANAADDGEPNLPDDDLVGDAPHPDLDDDIVTIVSFVLPDGTMGTIQVDNSSTSEEIGQAVADAVREAREAGDES